MLDTTADERFNQAMSLLDAGVRSLVAAPLLDPSGALGMIVLGSTLGIRQFTEGDMELLTSLASVAAMRIRNTRLAEEALERERLERDVALNRFLQDPARLKEAREHLARAVGRGADEDTRTALDLAGEIWMIRDYFARIGVEVVANITGDGRVGDIQRAHGAALNVVQCSGATMHLADMMKDKYGIPTIRVSYFGIDDMAEALYDVADHFGDPEMIERATTVVREELQSLLPQLEKHRRAGGRKARKMDYALPVASRSRQSEGAGWMEQRAAS